MYPNRGPPSDSDHRPNPRPYSAAADSNFYRWSQQGSLSSASSSSRSSAALPPRPSAQDTVQSLLTSCGLEPKDLAVLAKLPEDVLTVESLPNIIQQIKSKKGTVRPFIPTAASAPSSSSSSSNFSFSQRPTSSFTSADRDQLRSQPVQYPFQQIPYTAPASEPLLDFQGGRMTARSVIPPSSSSRAALDYDHRPHTSKYGKVVSSCSPAGPQKGPRPSRFSDAERTDHRTVAPADEFRRCSGSSSVPRPMASVPSKKQAEDFHGVSPQVFPYSCSLCFITVLSVKVWTEHVNSSVHANGQLRLLQQFPDWDCRVSSDNGESGRRKKASKDESRPAPSAQRAGQNQASQTSKQQKPSDRGRVVCVKFPAQAVDEEYLRELVEPFGKMGKILLFPSVAFVELGSADQAKDLVKFYNNSDLAVTKKQIEFSISSTFTFLQSSQVVTFTPAPRGKDGLSDLISIIKRFGEPLYTLFLPSKASVEMKFSADAQKLVNYYTSNTLRINNDLISVSFSSEYKSLMRVSMAQKYEEEPTKTTTRSSESSRDRRTRSRSRDRSRRDDESKTRSQDEINRDERTRCRSTDKRSRSRDKISRDKRTRSRSRDKHFKDEKTRKVSGDKSIQETTSSCKEESSSISKQNQSKENSERPDAGIKSEPEGVPVTEEQMCVDDGLSADDSDIEGMEVIAEDGEDVNDEDVEIEEEEKTNSSKERENSLEQDEEGVKGMKTQDGEEAVVVKEEEAEHTEPGQEKCGEEGKTSEVKEEEKEEEEASDLQKDEDEGFHVDLENCITLDQVDCDDEGGAAGSDGSKVLVEMSTPAESQRADRVLQSKPVLISNSRTSSGSTSGSEPPHHHLHSFPSSASLICHLTEDTAHSHSENRGLKKSDASDPDRTCSREGEGSLRKTLEEKTDETSEMETAENISKINSKSKTTEDQELKTTSEKELDKKTTDKRESTSRRGARTGHAIDSQEAEQSEEPSSDTKMKTETSQPEPQQNADMDRQSAPANSPAGPKKPATPVGAEFVRPVVGYFCNLCQLIFSDEDEAKLLHCSTPEHYRKYQEKTGKNPWMN
nr:matrin 3-like 1.1 isoform X2 [Nothobranchius furzeri]